VKIKILFLGILNCVCGAVLAGETPLVDENIQVEQYSYSRDLDVVKIISMDEIPNVCEVVPARMTYEDSKGHKHILEYRVMGNGCSSG
jgi:hypothetical protein